MLASTVLPPNQSIFTMSSPACDRTVSQKQWWHQGKLLGGTIHYSDPRLDRFSGWYLVMIMPVIHTHVTFVFHY